MRFQRYLTQGRIDTRCLDSLPCSKDPFAISLAGPCSQAHEFVCVCARLPSGWLVGPAGLQACVVFIKWLHCLLACSVVGFSPRPNHSMPKVCVSGQKRSRIARFCCVSELPSVLSAYGSSNKHPDETRPQLHDVFQSMMSDMAGKLVHTTTPSPTSAMTVEQLHVPRAMCMSGR